MMNAKFFTTRQHCGSPSSCPMIPNPNHPSNDQRLFLPPQKGHHLRTARRGAAIPDSQFTASSPLSFSLCPLGRCGWKPKSSLGLPEEERRVRGRRPPPNRTCYCYTHAPTHAHARRAVHRSSCRSLARHSRRAALSPEREREERERERGELYTRDGASAFFLPTGASAVALNRRSEAAPQRVTAAASCQLAAERERERERGERAKSTLIFPFGR